MNEPRKERSKAIPFVLQDVNLDTGHLGEVLTNFIVSDSTKPRLIGGPSLNGHDSKKYELVNDEEFAKLFWESPPDYQKVFTRVMTAIHKSEEGIFVDAIYISEPGGVFDGIVHYIVWQAGADTVSIRSDLGAVNKLVSEMGAASVSRHAKMDDARSAISSSAEKSAEVLPADSTLSSSNSKSLRRRASKQRSL